MTAFLVCGVDEVGRGSVAGPILAAAALFLCEGPKCPAPIEGIKDSKAFSSRTKRYRIFRDILLLPQLVDVAISEVDAATIDAKGIDWANKHVFKDAIGQLKVTPELVILDGQLDIGWSEDRLIVEPKADANYWQVGAASIIAKEVRDRGMRLLGEQFTGYGWDANAGYGTSDHFYAIQEQGLTPHHRRSFLRPKSTPVSLQPTGR